MERLLDSERHDFWTRADLERDIGGNILDVSDALATLQRTGLIHLTEQLVTVTRTARHATELALLF